MADGQNRVRQPLLWRHKVLSRIDIDCVEALQDLPGSGIHVADRLNLITKELNPHQPVFIGRADLQHISPHPKTTAGNLQVVAGILVVYQLPQGASQIEGIAHLKLDCSF